MNYLENLNYSLWASFQNGSFLEKDIEHGKAVGALDLAARIAHLDDDDMVRELCQDTLNDKNNE